MKSRLESIIRNYNRHRKPDVMTKLLDVTGRNVVVRFSGLRPETFFEDFRNELEEKTKSRFLVENIERDDGNRIVKFSIREERGPADDILDVLSKYYEGAPAPKQGHED